MGFCQQNGMERGQVQDWYANEKKVLVPVCLNEDKGDESLPLLVFQRDVVNAVFLKYSKESKFFSNYLGIRNIISEVYNYTKHY